MEREKTMSPFAVGIFTDNVVDRSWLWRCFTSLLLLSLKVSNSNDSSILGSIAAACACEIDGNEPITIDRF